MTPRGVSPAQTDRGQGVAPGHAHADDHGALTRRPAT